MRCSTIAIAPAVVACCFGAHRAHAECEPRVVVADGDATAVEVRDELSARGLGGTDESCPAVHATLTRDAAAISIDLVDTSGRTSHRSVATVSEAVTVIESWARSELTTDLLAGFEVAPDAESPAAPPVAPADELSVGPVVAHHASRVRDPLSGSMTGDVAVDANATRWIGMTATTCVRLARFCLGGTGHLRTATSFKQSDAALLATLELPLALAHVAWTPGVAAGIGRRMWNMTSGEVEGEGEQDQGASLDTRIEARITFSYSLGHRIFLDAVGAAEALLSTEQNEGNNAGQSPIAIFRIGAGLRIGAL